MIEDLACRRRSGDSEEIHDMVKKLGDHRRRKRRRRYICNLTFIILTLTLAVDDELDFITVICFSTRHDYHCKYGFKCDEEQRGMVMVTRNSM